MGRAGLVPGFFDGLQHAVKRRRLKPRGFFAAKRGVQVRIDAGDGDAVHIGVDGDELVHVRRQKAVAPHAGVDLDMRLGDHAALERDAV